MLSSIKSISGESEEGKSTEVLLKELRKRLKKIKKCNNSYFVNKNYKFKKLKSLYGQKSVDEENIENCRFVSQEEAIVDKCYKKSLELIKQKNKQKKIKKISANIFSSLSNSNCYLKPNLETKSTSIKPLHEIKIIPLHDENISLDSSNYDFKNKPISLETQHPNKKSNIKLETKKAVKNKSSDKIKVVKTSKKEIEVIDLEDFDSSIENLKTTKKNFYQNYSKNAYHQNPTNQCSDKTFDHIHVSNTNSEVSSDLDITYVQNFDPSCKIIESKSELSCNYKNDSSDTEVFVLQDEAISNNKTNKCSFSFENNINEDEVFEITDELSEINLPFLDLKEEPVDFVVPRLHKEEKVSSLTREKKKEFESEGIIIKSGRFSKAEKKLLKRNFNEFIKQFGLKDARLLLGIGRYIFCGKKENFQLKKFLKAKHFYVRLGRDINERTLESIYRKARVYFDPLRKKKKFSANDLSYLFELQKKYGNQWQLISKKIGFPAEHCQRYYSNYKQQSTKGEWTDEENAKLKMAIENIRKLSSQYSTGISWTKIAESVQSRNAKQCQYQWYKLETKKSQVRCRKWDRESSARLISILKGDCIVDDEVDIDWKRIFEKFKDVAPNIIFIKNKWSTHLKPMAPKELRKNFHDLINYLFEKYCKT